ncbi:MAG TPA: lipid A phosphate methyltransferase [Bacteroidales bacterium]|jgi:protein-S-isoprenylcysteine O-methyltransferase Ste14|nr:lipid A phosphate methyltransferase [Bacteroidales bacterium]HBZ21983.1 lipid A phosphate methyltransferase [Bacteroidales bacterium]
MALVHEFERSGNWLFKRRSWLPAAFIALGIIILYLTNRQAILFNMTEELIFLGVSLFGEAIRIFTVGYAPKNTSGRNTAAGQIADELNTTGIYSQLRHPLYTGNFFMWLGPVLFVRTSVFLVFFILVYWLYYERIMFAEEQFLRRKFGEIYDKYSEKVRAVIPRFRGYIKPALPFSVASVLKREYNSFVNIFIIFVLLDLFRNYFLSERIYLTPMWIYIGIPAGLIWIIIRLIFKKTSLLNDDDR